VGSVSMIDRNGASVAAQSDNTNAFSETIAMYIS
jgi:glucan 1,3-beta-glucosidase